MAGENYLDEIATPKHQKNATAFMTDVISNAHLILEHYSTYVYAFDLIEYLMKLENKELSTMADQVGGEASMIGITMNGGNIKQAQKDIFKWAEIHKGIFTGTGNFPCGKTWKYTFTNR